MAETGRAGGRCSVPQNCHALDSRRNLLEQLQPFSGEAVFIKRKPVALPPGRAKLSMKPAPTGSTTVANTIGTVRVACSIGPAVDVPAVRITSGASAANSAACWRILAASAVAQ